MRLGHAISSSRTALQTALVVFIVAGPPCLWVHALFGMELEHHSHALPQLNQTPGPSCVKPLHGMINLPCHMSQLSLPPPPFTVFP